MSPPARRAGRPPRLSRDAIVDAAQTIVAAGGIGALTMRRVATALEASPMAIYRHVADKDELLVLLLDRLAAEVPRPALPLEPRERVLAACRLMRDGIAQYPWIVDVLAGGDLIAPSILWVIEEIVAGLHACGLSHARSADGYRAIWQYTVGSLIVQRGIDEIAQLERPPYVVQVLTTVDPERLPTLAALAPHWAGAREQDSYELGLEPLVDGLLGRR
ncbi:MAG: TetR/AcrR family transcriptional regulator C-terminal domain-containing protein [Solirubrobacteraceae bacterium]